MHALALTAAVLAGAAAGSAPHSVRGSVAVPQSAGSPVAIAPLAGLHVAMDGGERVVSTGLDGAFAFANVSAGIHLIEIEHRHLAFATYKVSVPAADDGDVVVLEYRYPGAPKRPVSHPIDARPVAPAIYYEPRQRMSALSFLMNPQILLMAVMGGLVFCLPAMQKAAGADAANPENMDEETRQQMEMQQAIMSDPMGALGRLFSGQAAAPAPAAHERGAAAAGGRRPLGAGGDGGHRRAIGTAARATGH